MTHRINEGQHDTGRTPSAPYPEQSSMPHMPDPSPSALPQCAVPHLQQRPSAGPKHGSRTTATGAAALGPAQGEKTEADPFAFLGRVNTAFLIDDSEPLRPDGGGGGGDETERHLRYDHHDHWDEIGSVLRQVSSVAARCDGDGVDVYFVNHRPAGYPLTVNRTGSGSGRVRGWSSGWGYRNIGQVHGVLEMSDNVEGIFGHVAPRGRCRLGRALDRILSRHLGEVERGWASAGDLQQQLRSGTGEGEEDGEGGGGGVGGDQTSPPPLNVIVVTAGLYRSGRDDEDPAPALERAARRVESGRRLRALRVHFFQVGHSAAVASRLHRLAGQFGGFVEASSWDSVPGFNQGGGRPRPGDVLRCQKGLLSADEVLRVVGGKFWEKNE